MITQKMDRAWMAFKVARAARDAAQQEYDKAWALYSALEDANEADEADEADDDAEDRRIGGAR